MYRLTGFRNGICFGLAAIVLAINLPGGLLCPAKAEPISIGEGIALQWGTFYAADHFKSWEQEGLEASVSTFASGRLVLDALLGGGISLGTASETPVTLAAINGLPVRIVATINRYEPFDLVAVNDIKSGADLKGKKVGVALGTNAHYFFYKMLKKSNLNQSDVTLVNLSPSDFVSALANGSIDAFIWTEPHISEAIGAGSGRFHVVSFPELYVGYSAVIATQAGLEKNSAGIVRALKALIAADEVMAKAPDDAADIVAKRIKIEPKIVRNYWPRVNFKVALDKPAILKEMQEQAEWAIAAGIVRPGVKMPDLDAVVTTAAYDLARGK
jgi:ABC-type nitrate/sulfonate/bicarbonate transport system substrate-binding protein